MKKQFLDAMKKVLDKSDSHLFMFQSFLKVGLYKETFTSDLTNNNKMPIVSECICVFIPSDVIRTCLPCLCILRKQHLGLVALWVDEAAGWLPTTEMYLLVAHSLILEASDSV